MSPIRKIIVGLVLLNLGGSSHAEIPTWIGAEEPGQNPVWVSATEALPNGVARLEIFDEPTRQNLGRRLSQLVQAKEKRRHTPSAENECFVWSFLSHPAPDPTLTLEAHHSNSWQVYSGTIVDVAYGFAYGYPAMLIELAIEQTFKRQSDRTGKTPSSLYFVFRHAEIRTQQGMLCTRSRRYPDLPTKSSQAVIFAREPVRSEGSFLLQGRDDDIFFERADGTLSGPSFVGDQAIHVEDLEESLIELDLRSE